MARVTRFRPDSNVVHPLNLDRRTRPQDGSGGSVGLAMAVGVVALLLGGLVMHASAETPAKSATVISTGTASR